MINKYDFTSIDDKNIFIIGDIHGAFELTLHAIMTNDMFKDSLMIIAGDISFGFNKPQYYTDIMNKMNSKLSSINSTLLMIRGNHDDASYFNGIKINLSNIKAIPDYSVVLTKKTNILCIGGGLSIDRSYRKKRELIINRYIKNNENKKKLYWEDELPIYDVDKLNEIKSENIDINCIVTHTAPSFFPPTNKNEVKYWMAMDEKLEEDLDNERGVMDKIYYFAIKNFNLICWAYGHFHDDTIGLWEKIKICMISCVDEYSIHSKSIESIKSINNNLYDDCTTCCKKSY